MVCGKDLPQPFTLPCSSLSHPGSRVLHGTSTSHCPDSSFLPFLLLHASTSASAQGKVPALLIGDQGMGVAPGGGLLMTGGPKGWGKCEGSRHLLKG